MTTVILVLLCLAIAGRELYLASDKRLPRAQAELRDLRVQVAELSKQLGALQTKVSEPAGIPIPQPPAEGTPAETLDRVAALADRVEQAERELGHIGKQLEGLDLDREAQHALARSLDSVEHVVGELHDEMLGRLAREEGVVPGLVLSEEGEAEPLLSATYERCAAEYGLQIRVRDQRPAAGGGYWGTAYHLSGRQGDALSEELFAFARGLYDPQDPSALCGLLTELAHLRGGGVARIGTFTAVRTPHALLCGLVPDGERAEPWELAAQLRELPDEQQCDLTWLRTDDQP
ncbi:hypothetical protein [Spirillospora sp. NPDC047279]|uniref:hypothetical protein n=1 Tax=Spirillospora sp. NPDC047279 TaxID=3155478 RepID=UPI0033D918B9